MVVNYDTDSLMEFSAVRSMIEPTAARCSWSRLIESTLLSHSWTLPQLRANKSGRNLKEKRRSFRVGRFRFHSRFHSRPPLQRKKTGKTYGRIFSGDLMASHLSTLFVAAGLTALIVITFRIRSLNSQLDGP